MKTIYNNSTANGRTWDHVFTIQYKNMFRPKIGNLGIKSLYQCEIQVQRPNKGLGKSSPEVEAVSLRQIKCECFVEGLMFIFYFALALFCQISITDVFLDSAVSSFGPQSSSFWLHIFAALILYSSNSGYFLKHLVSFPDAARTEFWATVTKYANKRTTNHCQAKLSQAFN